MATATLPTTPTIPESIKPITSTEPTPTGLLTAPPVATYNPATTTAKEATATGYQMTPDLTVEGRVNKILASDSPLMQQARTRAAAAANSRGLLNSSVAVGAAQNAMIDKALPIASQDATAYNANAQFGAQAQNTASLTNAQFGTNVNLANMEAANKAGAENSQAFNTRALTVIDNDTKMALSTLDVQNRALLQANANAQQMFDEVVKNIAGIAVDATLSKEAKDQATSSQLELLREGLATTANISATVPAEVSQLDLSQYFQTDPAKMTPEQRTAKATQLQQAVTAAQAALPVWGDPAWKGQYEVHDGGKRESERTAENFNRLYAERAQALTQAQQALTAFQQTAPTATP